MGKAAVGLSSVRKTPVADKRCACGKFTVAQALMELAKKSSMDRTLALPLELI